MSRVFTKGHSEQCVVISRCSLDCSFLYLLIQFFVSFLEWIWVKHASWPSPLLNPFLMTTPRTFLEGKSFLLIAPQALWTLNSPWNSPGQNTGVGSLSLLQGIFPTQGWNPGLLPCRWILYQLSHQGSPKWPSAQLSSCFYRKWPQGYIFCCIFLFLSMYFYVLSYFFCCIFHFYYILW